MQKEIEKVCQTVIKKITPKESERAKIETFAYELEKRVSSACKDFGVEAEVRVEGSVAKDTWLSTEPDIDIFMRLPKSIPRLSLGEVALRIARKATEGSKQVERFAEHPYLEAFVDDVRVNIVPCYKTERGEWLSATDRTPFHTDYVKKRLNSKLKGEIRLLKKFTKAIDVYGAEIKIGGFSGYLCELLVLYYGSFVDVLKEFSQYKRRIVLDMENFYVERESELELLFNEPLVIVDPVDKGRNVASAVQPQKLYTFIAATRAFLENPNLQFFYPSKTRAKKTEVLRKELRGRGSTLVFVVFGNVNAVPDVLWGQLYRSQRSLHRLVELNDFRILRSAAWSDEESVCMFVFELEDCCLPNVKKHIGPPLEKEHECANFLRKYVANSSVVSGPYIEEGRWVVELKRKVVYVCDLLNERLRDGGKNAGVAEGIAKALKKGFKVLIDEEILDLYSNNEKFAEFLTCFLSGKPLWLKTH